jgi:transposase
MKNQNQQPTPTSQEQTEAKAEVIKLGVDVHAKKYVAVSQTDNETMRSPRSFTPEDFLGWAEQLKKQAKRIVVCYEAGCFGYVLYRNLVKLGIECLVVAPRKWDQGVKTDARDARELCSNLDRYLNGNRKALTVVHVPSPEEEQRRSFSRQRESLSEEFQRIQNMGTSHGRYYGQYVPADWWKPKVFAQLREELPDFLIELLEPWQRVLEVLGRELKEATAREERTTAHLKMPLGLGALTASVLESEFLNYERFNNRDAVSSFTGLCPGEASSGGKRRQGSVTKQGNSAIRHFLLEAVWRMFNFQPDYKPIKKWRDKIAKEGKLSAARKKKMAVAVARQFAVDWWRIRTGRAAPEELGLEMALPSAYAARAFREGRISKCYA